MQEESLRLPRSSYEELVKIIQAYASLNKEVSLSEVAQIAAVDATVVSGNNAFLSALGIVQGGKKKSITPTGKSLSLALQHELPGEIRQQWRAIATANSFLQKILSAVRIRKGMDISTLQAHIAYSAGQAKNPLTSTGAATVINILKAAELVYEDNDKVLATEQTKEPRKPEEGTQLETAAEMEGGFSIESGILTASTRVFSVPVQIQIQITCKPEELDSLGDKLRKLLSDLGQQTSTPFDKSQS
jgi:hypothetical protein